MEPGLYEELVTLGLQSRLADIDGLTAVLDGIDEADQPDVLARHVRDAVWRALRATRQPDRRIALVNDVLARLLAPADDRLPLADPQQLLTVAPPAGPGVVAARGIRPATPLSDAALLTNAHGEPALGSELRAEIDTSDEVDLLCAFVRWYGLRLLEPELSRVRDRGVPLRVITTTYLGGTERAALDRLVRDFGAEVKVQYDVNRTRLHAKAWLFRRRTRFDTAYVGSSNLSHTALLDGIEWNVRLSRVATPTLINKFEATFDTYWNESAFEPYHPDRDRDRLDDALAEASGRKTTDRVTVSLAGLEVRARPYQAEMLEALEVERDVHDRHRNLIVSATGTVKTVLAALDYRSLVDTARDRGEPPPSLLFVAHRAEILPSKETQSDAFFVTLTKSESEYSPTTMYRDYAISPELFHWESQSTTSVASATGQRYLNHTAMGWNILLFTRDHKLNEPQRSGCPGRGLTPCGRFGLRCRRSGSGRVVLRAPSRLRCHGCEPSTAPCTARERLC